MRMRDWSSDVGSSDLSRRGEALANVVGAEAWADGAFFDDVDRCRQRAGLQQQRQIMRFLAGQRSEEHTSELQSLMRISYAVFCLQKKTQPHNIILIDTICHHPITPLLINNNTP